MTENEKRMLTGVTSAIDTIFYMLARGAGTYDWERAANAWDEQLRDLRATLSAEWKWTEKEPGHG